MLVFALYVKTYLLNINQYSNLCLKRGFGVYEWDTINNGAARDLITTLHIFHVEMRELFLELEFDPEL